MVKILALALTAGLICASPVQAWTVRPVNSGQKLTATTPGQLEPFKSAPVQLQVARGEWESFQVVVTAGEKAIENLDLNTAGLATVMADRIPRQNFEIFRENYVYVPLPSGNRERRKLWWPDALIPLGKASTRIEAGQAAVFWVSVQVPREAEAGDYFGELDIRADGQDRRLALSLKVHTAVLPQQTLRANAALYYGVVRDWYAKNLKRTFSEEEWSRQQQHYYDFLLGYGINAYDLPVPWGSEAAANYLKDPRVLSVRTPPLDSPDFATALRQLKATGTLDKAYYYYIDEPQPERFAEIKSTTEKLRTLGVKHCVTLHPNDTLQDAVDIWCPNIGDFFGIGHLDVKWLADERKKGRETWWYTMVEPKSPYPTWLLDDDAESVRIYGPLMARYGITGFVYSMVHGWGPKPLEDLTSFAGTSGDGTLIYPGEVVGVEGPLPSIRLMLLRDAIEDYELCRRALAENGEKYMPWTHEAALEVLDNPPGAKRVAQVTSRETDLFPFRTSPAKFGWARPGARDSRLVPTIDGRLDDAAWTLGNQITEFGREGSSGDSGHPTKAWITAKDGVLYLACRADEASGSEWFAVDVAPEDLEARPERLRFVITTRGLVAAERHTREGRFRVEVPGLAVKAQVDVRSWTAEFAIPLEPLGYGSRVRFNVRRRSSDKGTGSRVTVSAYNDAGDPWNMPILKMPE